MLYAHEHHGNIQHKVPHIGNIFATKSKPLFIVYMQVLSFIFLENVCIYLCLYSKLFAGSLII